MNLIEITSAISDPMTRVMERCRTLVHSPIAYIQEMIDHVVDHPGKLLRPMLVFLSHGSGRRPAAEVDRAVDLALCVELVHIATLVHDDVIDDSDLRRGVATLHHVHGRTGAILLGDFLFSHAFVILAMLGRPELLHTLSAATARVCEGEILQGTLRHKLVVNRRTYLQLIDAKTAQLISAACRMGAELGHAGSRDVECLTAFGQALGMAFQIHDDWLDYGASREALGKPALSDLRNGFMTLPVIDLMEKRREDHPQEVFDLVSQVQQGRDPDDLLALMAQHRCLDATLDLARRYLEQARDHLSGLSDPELRRGLMDIPDLVLHRGT